MRRSLLIVGLAMSIVVAPACSGGDEDATANGSGDGTSTTVAAGETTGSTVGATESTATTTPVSEEPLFGGLGEPIVQLTPLSGEGPHPELAWEPVEGASHYSVYVYAPSGVVYWIWAGPATSIHVGGEPQLNDDAPGPSVIEGMSWAVMAHDDDQRPIAVSPERPIAP